MSDPCPQLPSYRSALSFVESPNFGNGVGVMGSWLGRTAIISVGFLCFGQNPISAIKNGTIAATAIELFVLGHALANQSKK